MSGVARRLLAESEAQTSLFTLWELDLLDESMEAWVIKPKFQTLFNTEELAEARRRLAELNYIFKDLIHSWMHPQRLINLYFPKAIEPSK